MTAMNKSSLLFLLAALGAAATAHAEKADRDKPVNLEADRITVDDANKVQIFEGNVQLIKGTLVIRTDKLVVSQDANGFQKGIAYGGEGGLAHFRQKREGRDEYVEGEGERIEHDDRGQKTEFFTRAHVKSGNDDVRGQYISYDERTENYVVTNGPNGTRTASKDNRVRAVIQPRGNKDGAETPQPTGPDVTLRSSTTLKTTH